MGDRANKHTMSRSPAMDTLRDLSSALWTLRSNQEAARVLRTTNSLLRCFLFFDICYLIMHMAHSLYFEQTQWRHVFLFFANIAVFSCWRHMHKQYILMALPRPQEQTVVDVESVMREYLSPVTTISNPKDLPPKYEEVEELPPQYDATTMESASQDPALRVAMPEEPAGEEAARK